MNKKMNMRRFYDTALLEGEGLGTAYEYYVKRIFLEKLIKKIGRPAKICVFGLPQKYGFSMDFCLFADNYNANVTVIDDRKDYLNKFKKVLNSLKMAKIISNINIKLIRTSNWNIKDKFDLLINTNVLQRFSNKDRKKMINLSIKTAKTLVFFIPNSDNISYIESPDRKVLKLEEIVNEIKKDYPIIDYGYIDIPPFPSGISLSKSSKEKIKVTKLNSLIFAFLKFWVFIERLIPVFIKKRFAHIRWVTIFN